MADITVQQLTKYYGDRLILDHISFDIQPGEKVAILGANGAGKTTLLQILAGRLDHDSGIVSTSERKTVGMIDQMPDFPEDTTVEDVLRTAFQELINVQHQMAEITARMALDPHDADLLRRYASCQQQLDALGGWDRDFEVDKICNGLDIPAKQRTQPFALLSGGEKTRVNLARIILEQTDILLLDEPTNHLDMEAVRWLGEYLEGYAGTIITVSHDRYFLDQCCTRIIEVQDGRLNFYAGSYSYYAAERERRHAQLLAQHEHQMAEKQRLEAVSRLMHERGTEHLAKRAASIDKRIARMKVTDRPRKDKKMGISFGEPNYETQDVLRVRDITKSYNGHRVLQGVTFQVQNGERVAILGENGTGKTTLLRILLGEETADAGTVRKGAGLRPAYLPQQVHFAHEERNLIDTLIYNKNVTMQTARNRLGAFHFSGEDQLKTVRMLSGGEKSRLRLCELMYDPLNMLILDEPTNHLDLLSREWIEEAVEAFTGTLLFVSHDRYFVERFATRILYLSKADAGSGQPAFIDFAGTYEAFLIHRDRLLAEQQAAQPAEKPQKREQKEKPKTRGGTKNLAKRMAVLEREIAQMEDVLADLDRRMGHHAADPEKLMLLLAEKEEADTALIEKLDEWESVGAELEAQE